ncbi:energy-coupling factor ABC transporter permease [Nostoc sp. CHAB 5834]|nr:energy-coupling factor ABC transporter permease [Nostoc sp. CHAB 5834]
MHIEPGIVDGAKMALAYGTAAAAAAYTLKLAVNDVRAHTPASFALRTAIAAVGTFICFEVLPTFPVGVSEVHFILGTTLFLILGAAPSAIGLAAGLLVQSIFFAPSDLPMLFVNLTTLLMPLFAIDALARRVVPAGRAYVDLSYAQVLKLSAAYQGGIVAWVAFWAIYGQGFEAENTARIFSFGAAYMLVILLEPVVDLGALAIAKALRPRGASRLVARRLYAA